MEDSNERGGEVVVKHTSVVARPLVFVRIRPFGQFSGIFPSIRLRAIDVDLSSTFEN